MVVGKQNLVLTLVSQATSSEGEPVPLNRVMPDQSNVSSWVLLTVKEIQQGNSFGWDVKALRINFWHCTWQLNPVMLAPKNLHPISRGGAKEINMFH